MLFDLGYWGIIIIGLLLGAITQGYISSAYNKYSKVSNGTGMTGAQCARKMLDENGLHDVSVQPVAGTLSDHYDPRTRTVRLSEGIYGSQSVSAMAVACHECGHAIQHARGYTPMQVRTALVPVANLGASLWIWLLIIGMALNMMSLYWAGIVLFAFAVAFHVVTLPVEFNASRRGLAFINGNDNSQVTARYALALPGDPAATGAATVLRAAALTYVASALTSILQLLYFIGLARR